MLRGRGRVASVAAAGAALGLCAGNAAAQELAPPPAVGSSASAPAAATSAQRGAASPRVRLRYDLRVDVPVTLVGGGAWITAELLKNDIAPLVCRWCDTDAAGRDALNGLDAGVRAGLHWRDTRAADTLSNVFAFALMPVTQFGLLAVAALDAGHAADIPFDALMLLEATAIAVDVNQLVKFIAGRQRPFVHFATPAELAMVDNPADSNLSFFSGHTTLAFSIAVASGTIASMRGYRMAPWIWGTGLALATFVGYLRIAADRHYLTDVFTGAVLGSGIGFVVPWLFHAAEPHARPAVTALVTPVSGGAQCVVAGVF